MENYQAAEEQKSPVAAAKSSQATRSQKIKLRVNGGRKMRGRAVPRITVPGEVLAPYDLDFESASSSDSSSGEDEDGEEVMRCVDGKQRLTSIQKFFDGQVRTYHPPYCAASSMHANDFCVVAACTLTDIGSFILRRTEWATKRSLMSIAQG